jgi:hypothetical protein
MTSGENTQAVLKMCLNAISILMPSIYRYEQGSLWRAKKSPCEGLTETIDFNKHVHDIDIFINDKWRKYAGGDSSKLQGDLNFSFDQRESEVYRNFDFVH